MFTLREWQQYYKKTDDLIVQASAVDGTDSWQPFPIGMQYNYVYNFKKGPAIQIGNHAQNVLCAVATRTDQGRRPEGINRKQIVEHLKENGIENTSIKHTDYFQLLPHYKFVISPEGNGIDCHRHYEALIAGCIPIMEYNALTQSKYKGCPVLYTTDYREITEDYLLQKYNEMIDMKYDFSTLFLSAYNEEMQKEIKMCGNFWTQKLTNQTFYN
jgi:hypothetical protein